MLFLFSHCEFYVKCTYIPCLKIVDNTVNMQYDLHEVNEMSNITYNVRINKKIREEADILGE